MNCLNNLKLSEESGVILELPNGKFFATGRLLNQFSETTPQIYITHFFENSALPYTPEAWGYFSREEILSFLPSPTQVNHIDFCNPSDHFQKALKHLGPNLEKIVCSKRSKISLNSKCPFSLISSIIKNNTPLFYALWKDGKGICGHTPELLFERLKSRLKTMALAGTFRESDDIRPSLVKEHELVRNDLCIKLSKIGEVHIGKKSPYSFASYKHLRQEIACEIQKPISTSQLISLLHPTPALNGMPQTNALNFLKSSEERFFYGAPVTLRDQDYEISYVMIRGVEWHDKDFFIQAGCGLVDESELSKEVEEYRRKVQSVAEFFYG